jgi:tetratricopeptide (TPR) repeat protein
VYSLGVLLYELLAGVTPFDGERLRSSTFGEIQRMLKEEDPPRPSTRFSSREDAPEIAANRTIESRRLFRNLRGDLDWITLKALDKDRNRRYSSAVELADDIRRHRADVPVVARPPSSIDKFGKFVRRNRAAVLGVAAVFVVLVAGVVATSLALARAATAAEQSQQIASFMQQMLGGIDPKVARGKDTELLRKIFEDTAARLGGDLAAQPEVEAAIRDTIGRAYLALGEYDLAASHLKSTLEIRQRVLGGEHPDTLSSLGHMGCVLNRQGKLAEAEVFSRQALDGRRRVLGNDHPDTLWSMNDVSTLLSDQGRLQEAEALTRESLEGRRRVLGNDHPDTLVALNNMGAAMWDQGRLAEAEMYYRESLQGNRRVLGEDHPNTLTTISNLGRLLNGQGKMAEAEIFLRDAMQSHVRVLGKDHPDSLSCMNSMGVLLGSAGDGRLAEAEEYLRAALDGRRRVLGEDHPDTLISINNMGDLLSQQGKLVEAEQFLRQAMEGNRRVLGGDHPNTLRSIHNMGWIMNLQGKVVEAERYYREALDGRRRVLPGDHPEIVPTIGNLARVLLSFQADDPHEPSSATEALQLALEANSITEFSSYEYLDTLALAYHKTGDAMNAARTQRKALEMCPVDSPRRLPRRSGRATAA